MMQYFLLIRALQWSVHAQNKLGRFLSQLETLLLYILYKVNKVTYFTSL